MWPRWVRCAIFALFAVMAVVTVSIGMAPTDTPATTTTSTSLHAASESLVAADEKYVVSGDRFGSNNELKAYVASGPGSKDSLELLPAYRWRNVDLQSELAVTDLSQVAGNGFANFFFSLANIIWMVLLKFLHWAVTVDPVSYFTGSINSMFVGISNTLWSTGLVAIALAATAFVVVKQAFKGHISKTVSTVAMCIIPLAGLQVLTTYASQGTPDQPARMSPAWLAQTGSDQATTIGSGAVVAIANNVPALRERINDTTFTDGGETTCSDYTAALTANFVTARQIKKDPAAIKLKDKDAMTAETGSLVIVSRLWEESFLSSWQMAQFGHTKASKYSSCRVLEMINNKSTADQYAIVGGTTSGAKGEVKDTQPKSGPFAQWGSRAFTTTFGAPRSSKEIMPYVFAWAACSKNGGNATQQLAPGWANLNGEERVNHDRPDNGSCVTWAKDPATDLNGLKQEENAGPFLFSPKGDGKQGGTLRPDNPGDLVGMTDPNGEEGKKAGDPAALAEVQSAYTAYWGHNGGQRLMASLVALAGAAVYGYTLIGLAVGSIIAQFAFAIMMGLLPISLFAAAFSRNNPGGNVGLRMLKLTFGLGLAKIVLLAAITVMMVTTVLIASFGSSDSMGGSLLALAAPLVAFFMVKMGASKLGFGNIMSMGGAAGLSTAGAAAAVGDKKSASGASGMFGRLGKKNGKTPEQRLAGSDLTKKGRRGAKAAGAALLKSPKKAMSSMKSAMVDRANRAKARAGAARAAIADSQAGQAARWAKAKLGISSPDGARRALASTIANGRPIDNTAATGLGAFGKGDPAQFDAVRGSGRALDPVVAAGTLAARLKAEHSIPVDGTLQSLSDEGVAASRKAFAAVHGVPEEAVLMSTLGLPAVIVGGTEGQGRVIMNDKGEPDVAASVASLGVTSLLTSGQLAEISDAAAKLQVEFPHLGTEEASSLAMNAALETTGLSQNGSHVDPRDYITEDVARSIEEAVAKGHQSFSLDSLKNVATTTVTVAGLGALTVAGAKELYSHTADNAHLARPVQHLDMVEGAAKRESSLAQAAQEFFVPGENGAENYSALSQRLDALAEQLGAATAAISTAVAAAASNTVEVNPSEGAATAAHYSNTLDTVEQKLSSMGARIAELTETLQTMSSQDRNNKESFTTLNGQIRHLSTEMDGLVTTSVDHVNETHRAAVKKLQQEYDILHSSVGKSGPGDGSAYT